MNARDLGGGTAPFLRENEAFDLFVTIFFRVIKLKESNCHTKISGFRKLLLLKMF